MTSRALAHRAAWNVADQALSSLSNAALSIVAAKVTTTSGFGQFSVAFATYSFLVGFSRALTSSPYVLHGSSLAADVARRSGSDAGGLAVTLGLGCVALGLPAALLWGGQYTGVLMATAILMPALLLQDTWRNLLIARGRARAAAANDAVWLALQAGLLGLVVVGGQRAPWALVLAWGVAAAVAAIVGVRQWGAPPRPMRSHRYLRAHLGMSRFLAAEYLAVLGCAQLALFLVAGLGSAADVGALRGAMTLLGPLNILGVGVFAFLLPEVLRRPHLSGGRLLRIGTAVTTGLATIDVAWGGALLLLPQRWGERILGDTWVGARATLLPMTIFTAGVAVSTGAMLVIRSRGGVRESFRINAVLGPLLLCLTVAGVATGGAPGAAWGYAAATVLTAPLWCVRAVTMAKGPALSATSMSPPPA